MIRPALIAMLAFAPHVAAQAVYLAADVPTELDGTSYESHQIFVRSPAGTDYALVLPVEVSALHRFPDGAWVFAPRTPVELGGASYGPRDLVVWDGSTFSSAFDGAAAGVPEGAVIDAIFAAFGVFAVASFDIPVHLDGVDYSPSDLIALGPPVSLYWDAAAAGVPAYANLVGADESGDGLVLSFDVPVQLAGIEYFPGQLVYWESGTSFANFAFDPAWPARSQLRDFSLLPTAGAIAGGGADALILAKAPAGEIVLTWGTSCLADPDYEVYEGALGTFDSHLPRQCSTGGATTAQLSPDPGSAYYLVVPANLLGEGSYGVDSAGGPRPPQSGACLPQAPGECPAP